MADWRLADYLGVSVEAIQDGLQQLRDQHYTRHLRVPKTGENQTGRVIVLLWHNSPEAIPLPPLRNGKKGFTRFATYDESMIAYDEARSSETEPISLRGPSLSVSEDRAARSVETEKEEASEEARERRPGEEGSGSLPPDDVDVSSPQATLEANKNGCELVDLASMDDDGPESLAILERRLAAILDPLTPHEKVPDLVTGCGRWLSRMLDDHHSHKWYCKLLGRVVKGQIAPSSVLQAFDATYCKMVQNEVGRMGPFFVKSVDAFESKSALDSLVADRHAEIIARRLAESTPPRPPELEPGPAEPLAEVLEAGAKVLDRLGPVVMLDGDDCQSIVAAALDLDRIIFGQAGANPSEACLDLATATANGLSLGEVDRAFRNSAVPAHGRPFRPSDLEAIVRSIVLFWTTDFGPDFEGPDGLPDSESTPPMPAFPQVGSAADASGPFARLREILLPVAGSARSIAPRTVKAVASELQFAVLKERSTNPSKLFLTIVEAVAFGYPVAELESALLADPSDHDHRRTLGRLKVHLWCQDNIPERDRLVDLSRPAAHALVG